MHVTQVMKAVLNMHVHTCVFTFPVSGRAAHFVLKFGIWFKTTSYAFLHATSGVHLHLLACVPLSHILRPTGRIMLKCVFFLLHPLTMLFAQVISR